LNLRRREEKSAGLDGEAAPHGAAFAGPHGEDEKFFARL